MHPNIAVGIRNVISGDKLIADVVAILRGVDENTATTKEGRSPLRLPYTCSRKHHMVMLSHTGTRSKGHALPPTICLSLRVTAVRGLCPLTLRYRCYATLNAWLYYSLSGQTACICREASGAFEEVCSPSLIRWLIALPTDAVCSRGRCTASPNETQCIPWGDTEGLGAGFAARALTEVAEAFWSAPREP